MRDISTRTLDSFGGFYASLDPSTKLRMEPTILLRDVSLGVELTTLVSQMNLLLTLARKQGATHEIAFLAKRVTQSANVARNMEWQNRILGERIHNKKSEIGRTRSKWRRSSAWIRCQFLPAELEAFNNLKRTCWSGDGPMRRSTRDRSSNG